jgi:hypothetical protein
VQIVLIGFPAAGQFGEALPSAAAQSGGQAGDAGGEAVSLPAGQPVVAAAVNVR